ncbi:MAG: chalcone isomerase family protein, partial [Bdellovibrionota bacterium]
MKAFPLFLALAALTSTSAFASILQLEDSGTKVSGVTVSKGGKMSVAGRDAIAMKTVGAGTRTKLGFMSIYVGELLVSDPTKYACREDKSLESLKSQAGVAVKLNILYGITEAQLEEAFTTGFESNKIKVTPEIQKFVDSIKSGGPIPSGSKL